MRTLLLVAIPLLTLSLASAPLHGQRKRRGPQTTATAGAYNLPAVTFNGALKELTTKTIVIASDDGQTVTIYRNRKTHFLRGETLINPKQIEPGMKLTIDVAKNPDASLLAVNVIVLPAAAR